MQEYVCTLSPFLIYRQGILALDISQVILNSRDQRLICNTHTETGQEQAFKVLLFTTLKYFLY